jgi:arylsulfatase A-like enzyme
VYFYGELTMKKIIVPASLAAVACLGQSAVSAAEKPNILIILADDLGYADFGFQGAKDIPTPNIDALAKSGTIFTDAHVSASVCSPSRAGLMTGIYQQRFGHEANCPPPDKGMDVKQKTLADYLKSLGYRTGVIGKWHLGDKDKFHPLKRGFDYFYGFREGGRPYFHNAKKIDKKGNPRAIEKNWEQVSFDGYLTDVFGEKAVEFLESSATAGKPFFLYLAFNAPHSPYQAKDEDLAFFAGKIKNKRRRVYAAMVYALDRAIGRVMKTLDAKKLRGNTLVFFLSDNGGPPRTGALNTPLNGSKGIDFEGGIRVPFIVSWPGHFPSGKKCAAVVSSLDIAPTCLSVAGSAPPKKLVGENLFEIVKNGKRDHSLFWRKLYFGAVRLGPWKLIEVDGYGYALYNLEKDLGESENLSKKMPEKLAQLKAIYERWRKTLVEPLWGEGGKWKRINVKRHINLIEGKPELDKIKY